MARALQLLESALGSGGKPCGRWGGARNRADRESWQLTAGQVDRLIAVAANAERVGLAFNRHWTIHHERAGIPNRDGARFIGKLLHLARQQAKRAGGEMAALWLRENGHGKGAHVHILMHLPPGLLLQNRTGRWIKAAGGKPRTRVGKIRSIGGSLGCAETSPDRYRANLEAALAYVLKCTDRQTGNRIGLPRCEERGLVIGKRCGWTHNIRP